MRTTTFSLFGWLALGLWVALACSPSVLGTEYNFTVSGKVDYEFKTDATYHALENVKVEIWDDDWPDGDHLLESTYTDSDGDYNVLITSSEAPGPDIYVRAILEEN